MISLKTSFECETAHRLYDVNTYSEECRDNLHGHSYKYTVEVARKDGRLNEAGMVCDFKLLKKVLSEFEKKYDHSCILKAGDPLVEPIKTSCKKVHIVEGNPTAEWMVCTFVDEMNVLFDEHQLDIEVISLEIAETTNNVAIWRK